MPTRPPSAKGLREGVAGSLPVDADRGRQTEQGGDREIATTGLVPRVSVIVPAYNAEETIAAALRSALSQEMPVHEVIVVDDGSGDGTTAVVQGIGGVRLIEQRNAGPAAARNAGIAAATGDWLAFLDADDVWLPQKIRVQCALLAAHPEVAMCSSDWVRAQGLAPPAVDPGDIALRRFGWREILRLNRFQTSTALVRRDVAERVGGFRTAIDGTEDWDFWLRCSRHTDDLHLVAPLVVYRDVGTSYSKNSMRVYSAMHRMLAEWGPPDGPIAEREFRRLLAWHDVRFAYSFWRQHKRRELFEALRDALSRVGVFTLLGIFLFSYLPYLLGRGRRRLSARPRTGRSP